MTLCRLLLGLLLLPLGVLAVSEKPHPANLTIEKLIQLRTHSLYAPYIDQDLQNRWWDFGADAYVNTNKHIRLTRQRPSQMGWLWSRLPLTAANYVIEIEFKISGEANHIFGDGLAIWLTKDRALPGPVFGSKDNFDGLGIFLDTYANSRHSYSFPRITAMLGDGNTRYDHDNDGEAHSIGACSANIRRTNVATKIRITYFKNSWLDVKLQHKAWDEWTDCFSVEGAVLPNGPFVGFSALTGDVDDAHDIISVTTSSALLGNPERPKNKIVGLPFVKDLGSGSWFLFLMKVLFFAGICAGAFYGYKIYEGQPSSVPTFGGGGRGGRFSIAAIKNRYYSSSKRF